MVVAERTKSSCAKLGKPSPVANKVVPLFRGLPCSCWASGASHGVAIHHSGRRNGECGKDARFLDHDATARFCRREMVARSTP
jgi:hypothetical protein